MNFNFFTFIYFEGMSVYAHIHEYCGVCGEVRGRLARVGSLLSCGFQRLKLGHEYPDSPAHLTSPYVSEFQI